jgi:hypothetical protein
MNFENGFSEFVEEKAWQEETEWPFIKNLIMGAIASCPRLWWHASLDGIEGGLRQPSRAET